MVLRLISSLFFPQKCPFCSERLVLREREGTYYCTKCQTNFIEEVDEEGEGSLEPHYPSSVHQASGTQRATHFHPLLCQPCNNHQSIILQLLSAYSEEHANGSGVGENWEQEYQSYKSELERRYPLCMACRVAVSERLKQQDFRLRSFTSTARTRRAVTGSNVVRRNRDRGLFIISLNVLYVAAIYLGEYLGLSDVRVVQVLSLLLFASIFLYKTAIPFLTIACMTSPYYAHHIPISEDIIPYSNSTSARCIAALSFCFLNLIIRLSMKRPNMRVHKAATREGQPSFSLSLKDDNSNNNESENTQGRVRNPFLSKSLLNSGPLNNAGAKSMPTSPLYTNKFASPSLKPTQLSFKSTATGLEDDFLESFSLSENTTSSNGNRTRGLVSSNIKPLVVLDLMMRLGAVYLRFVAMLNTSFQALIFAAAYGLFFNLDSGLHRRLPKMSRYLISLLCALRFVWLGLDIGQPGWSMDLDAKLQFPREYLAFGLDAFLLVFFSPK